MKIETIIKIAADDIIRLRACDVYRVLCETPARSRGRMAEYIRRHRPDLADEVSDAMADIKAGVC